MFAETWAAAADALARDPALALAPLRALRDRRFVRPRPGANGWPDAAVPTLFAALDASRSCAAASPTLAGELWGAAAGLLAAWARWHAPRSVVSETNGAGGAASAAAATTLSRVVDVVAAARDAFSSVGFHVPGGPLGPMPALCLACVAASPAAPRETRARALASALETLNRLAPENAFASAAEARALAASFAYACAAAEDLHTATHAVSVESLDAHGDAHGNVPGWIDATSLARVFFPLWRGVGKPFASAENLSAAAQRAGLLLARAAHATARRSFPRIAASLARNARDVLVRSERLLGEPRGSPLAIPPGHSGAAFVAAGTLLACRRPVPDGAEATALDGDVSRGAKSAQSSSTDATALDVGALRVAEAHAAEAVVAAAAVSAALAADDALADAVADASSRGSRVSFEGVSNHEENLISSRTTDATMTMAKTSLVAAAWSALAAGALSASRCVAERAFDSDASSFFEHDIDATRRVGKQTCFFAVVSGAYRFAAAPLLVAAKCARARTDPASASAAVASARAAPLAARAHALIDLACGELARGRTRGEGSFAALSPRARFAARATARFARDAHEGYAFFLASTPAEWRGALDAASVWPALTDARLAVVVACEHLTALALEEEDPDRDSERASGNDIETLRVSLSVAACDALAYVEFARGPAFDAHMSRRGQIETRAVLRAQMGSARYALALTRLAAALGADSPAGAALRKRFALESVPEVPEGSPPSASLVPRDSRANVFLRLVPYFASGAFGNAPGSLVTARALPLALHYVSHQSPGFARAAHLALAASFRAAPAATVPDAFAPYVERSLERLYASGSRVFSSLSSLDAARASAPVEEAFASTVLVVAECGGATRQSRDAVAAGARALVERAKRLDAFSSSSAFSSDVDTNAENAEHAERRTKNAKNARTLRRLVFALLPLVDHALVPDVQSAAEEAVLSVCPYRRAAGEEGNGGANAPRLAAYADLVRSVMAIGDVARKGAATQWALRLRARL